MRHLRFHVSLDTRSGACDIATISVENLTEGYSPEPGKRVQMGILALDGYPGGQFVRMLTRGAKALCTEHDTVEVQIDDWASHEHHRRAVAAD